MQTQRDHTGADDPVNVSTQTHTCIVGCDGQHPTPPAMTSRLCGTSGIMWECIWPSGREGVEDAGGEWGGMEGKGGI